MGRLRNLSVRYKLALSAFLGMLMLAAMAGSALRLGARFGAAVDGVAAATAAERDIRRAAMAAHELAVVSGMLQRAPLPAEIDALRARADAAARDAEAALAARAGTAQANERAAVEAARRAIIRDVAAIARQAALRRDLVAMRDETFVPLEGQLSYAASRVEALLDQDTDAERQDRMRRHLARLRGAIATLRGATSRFLDTQEAEARTIADGALGAARIRLAALRQGLAASSAEDAAKDLAERVDAQIAVTQALFERLSALSALFSGELAAARGEVETTTDAAVAAFAASAVAHEQAAAKARLAGERTMLGLASLCACVLVLSAWLIGRAVARPLRAITEAATRVADGDVGVELGFAGRRDEIGRLAAAVGRLQAEAANAFVMGQMIEQLPLGLLTAQKDGKLRVTYVNPVGRALLEPAAARFPRGLAALEGQSIEPLFEAPDAFRAAVAGRETLPIQLRVRLGAETLEVRVGALDDHRGRYIGPMLTIVSRSEQARLVARFEATIGSIAAGIGSAAAAMRQAATAMRDEAAEGGVRAGSVAAASDAAAGHVQAVAASAEQLAASVAEIARQVAASAAMATQAVGEAEATDRSIAGLADAAARIGDVVRLIGDIAGRTNLLALNATIEAARAGAAGKGFAVVASEVKALATQTAQATQEIGAQIGAIQAATEGSVQALRAISAMIRRMNEISAAIAGAVEQQGAATREIAAAVQEAAGSSSAVAENIALTTAVVDATGGRAAAVLDAAVALAQRAETLSRESRTFLTEVQAAA
jgi:methyl-accepting chemotaxis protein